MLKFTKLTDIWNAESVPKYIRDSMEEQMFNLCKEYLVDEITEFGAFFFVENEADLDNYRETGMVVRIEEDEPEFVKFLKDDSGNICYQSCHIVSDDYGVYIFREVSNITSDS